MEGRGFRYGMISVGCFVTLATVGCLLRVPAMFLPSNDQITGPWWVFIGVTLFVATLSLIGGIVFIVLSAVEYRKEL